MAHILKTTFCLAALVGPDATSIAPRLRGNQSPWDSVADGFRVSALQHFEFRASNLILNPNVKPNAETLNWSAGRAAFLFRGLSGSKLNRLLLIMKLHLGVSQN